MNKTKIFIASALTAMAAACSSPEKNELNLIPYPLEVEQGNGSFNAAGTSVTCCGIEDPVIISSIKDFAGRLSAVSGKRQPLKLKTKFFQAMPEDSVLYWTVLWVTKNILWISTKKE